MPTPPCSAITLRELLAKGWSVKDVLKQTMALDYDTLPGLTTESEGDPEQWIAVSVEHPETVQLVLSSEECIVGYWHFVAFFPDVIERIERAEFVISDVTSDNVPSFELPGTYDMFFVIIAMAPEYRAPGPMRKLFASFFDTLEHFARERVFFRNVYAHAFTPSGASLCRGFGMQKINRHPHFGDVYRRALFPFPQHELIAEHREMVARYEHHFSRRDSAVAPRMTRSD